MHAYRELRGLPRTLWILCAAIFVNRAGTMALPMLNLWLTEERGLSPTRAGNAFLVYGAVALCAAPLSGSLSDRFGPRRVMVAGLVGSAAALFVLPSMVSLGAILGVTACWALCAELVRPASMAAVGILAPVERRQIAFALSRIAINLGVAIGAPLAGFLAESRFSLVFFVNATIGALVALLIAPQRFGRKGDGPPPTSTPFRLDRSLVLLCVSTVIVGMIVFQFEGALPLYVVEHLGKRKLDFTLLLALNAALIVIIEVPLNSMTSRWSTRRTLILATILLGFGFGGYALPGGYPMAVATTIVWTFGEMMLFPAQSAYVTSVAPPGQLGRAMGLYSLSFGLAFSFGPNLGNRVYQHLGPEAVWIGCFAIALLSCLLISRLRPVRG